MNNSNEDTKRTYVPKTIGDSIQKINKKYSNKYGKIEYLIISKWPQIVGSFFANHSEPNKISRIQEKTDDMGNSTYIYHLYVNVSPAAAIEFQHYKDKIKEKINSYFGYKAITELKLQQNFVNSNSESINHYVDKKKISEIDQKNIKNEVNHLKDKDLQKSIVKLGLSITKMNK